MLAFKTETLLSFLLALMMTFYLVPGIESSVPPQNFILCVFFWSLIARRRYFTANGGKSQRPNLLNGQIRTNTTSLNVTALGLSLCVVLILRA